MYVAVVSPGWGLFPQAASPPFATILLYCSAPCDVCVYPQVEQTPENFRTIGALRRTMMHLRSIMDRQDMPLVNIHKYLWDRFRGVRQDLFVQGIEVRGPLCFAPP